MLRGMWWRDVLALLCLVTFVWCCMIAWQRKSGGTLDLEILPNTWWTRLAARNSSQHCLQLWHLDASSKYSLPPLKTLGNEMLFIHLVLHKCQNFLSVKILQFSFFLFCIFLLISFMFLSFNIFLSFFYNTNLYVLFIKFIFLKSFI